MEHEWDVEDFFPLYPERTSESFYYDIYKKKEFYSLRLPEKDVSTGIKGLYNYQRTVARFMNRETTYDELFVFHDPGTGKTCTAGAIGESYKIVKTALNDKGKLIHLPMQKRILVITNPLLIQVFIHQLMSVCVPGEYLDQNDIGSDLPDPNDKNITDEERIERLSAIAKANKKAYNAAVRHIKKYYEFTTFKTFAGVIDRAYAKGEEAALGKAYSDRLIMIDEGQNLRIQESKRDDSMDDLESALNNMEDNPDALEELEFGDEKSLPTSKNKLSMSLYELFHKFLHLVTNCRKIIFSATPMVDNANEAASFMNLILPADEQMKTGKAFYEAYKSRKDVEKFFRGRISYVRADNGEGGKMAVRIEKGMKMFEIEAFKIFPSYAHAFQQEGYFESISNNNNNNANDQKKNSFHNRSRFSSLFVFPDGSYGSRGLKKYVRVVKSGEINSYSLVKDLKNYITKDAKDKDDYEPMLERLNRLSCKFTTVIRILLKDDKKLAFVYSDFVRGGAALFAKVLELFGFEPASLSDNTKGKRYVLLSDNVHKSMIPKWQDYVSNSRNRYGEYCKVIVASPKLSIGVSFKNVRQEHILGPFFNNSKTEQVFGRGIRSESHFDLSPDERVVEIYRHAFLVNDKKTPTVDIKLYQKSYEKDVTIKVRESWMKESAIDCAANYNRNVLPLLKAGIKGSSECDYQNCDLKCEGIDHLELSESELDHSTFNLYYAADEVSEIIEIVKAIFRMKYYSNFGSLVKEIREVRKNNPLKSSAKSAAKFALEISKEVIISALDKLVKNRIKIVMRDGSVGYLNEKNNVFFLTRDITGSADFSSNYFVNNLSFAFENPLEQVTNGIMRRNDARILSKMAPLTDVEKFMKLFNELSPEVKVRIVETIYLEQNNNNLNKEKEEVRAEILKLFSHDVMKVKDDVIHFINYTLRRKIRTRYGKNTIEASGLTRILKKNGTWTNVKVADEVELLKELNDRKENRLETLLKKTNIIGIRNKDGSLNIIDKTKEKYREGDDRTKMTKGRHCPSAWTRVNLIYLLYRLGALPEKEIVAEFEDMSVEDLEDEIPDSLKGKDSGYNSKNKQLLVSLASWNKKVKESKYKNINLCKIVDKELTRRNYVIDTQE
jgi:hypothetical protein